MMTSAIPEKNTKTPIHGDPPGTHWLGGQFVTEVPSRVKIISKHPTMMSVNPSVWRVYLSSRGKVLPL